MRFRAFSPHGFSAGQCLSKSGCQLSSGFVCVVFKVSLTLKNYNFWLLENICVFIYLNKIYFKAVYLYHVMYPDVTMFSSTYCSTIVWSTSVLLVPFSYANTACTSLYTHTHINTRKWCRYISRHGCIDRIWVMFIFTAVPWFLSTRAFIFYTDLSVN